MESQITEEKKTEITLEIHLDSTELGSFIDKAVENLGANIELKGFRKGKAPRNVVEEHVGEQQILTEAADLAVNDSYRKAIEEHKIEPISFPNVEVKNLKKEEGFTFIAKVPVLPSFDLPDYKVLASKIKRNEIKVEDSEVQQAMDWLRKSRSKLTVKNDLAQKGDFVQIEYMLAGKEPGSSPIQDGFILGEGRLLPGFEEGLVGMKAGDEKKGVELDSNGKKFVVDVKMVSVQNVELPEFNDEFAKSLGKFSGLDSLRNNVKEGVTREKEQAEAQRVRNEILEAILKEVKIEVPETLIQNEQVQMLETLKAQIAQALKMSFDDYLKSTKKTNKDILDSLKTEAENKIKRYLILREIGKKEGIEVKDEESIEKVFKKLTQ